MEKSIKYVLTLEEDDGEDFSNCIVVELTKENYSVYNLFKGLENILLEAGFTDEDIFEYYVEMMNQSMS